MYKLKDPKWIAQRNQIIEDFKKEKGITTKAIPFIIHPEWFGELCSRIHDNKYDYSKVIYKNNKEKVIIICPIHGEFLISPSEHLRGVGCRACNLKYDQLTATDTESFIRISKSIHGENTFDYSKTVFKSMNQKVILICNNCGLEFETQPSKHIRKKNGCPHCNRIKAGKSHAWTKEKFIEEANKIHHNAYDYTESIYIDSYTPLKIRCKEHNEYFWVSPSNHIHSKQGCPLCRGSISKGEQDIKIFLEENNIKYFSQFTFENCKDINPLPFDFYLPDYNCCIEYQGKQHFKPVEKWGGIKNLETYQKHDQIKKDYCNKENITLIEILYNEKTIPKLKEELNKIH